MRQLKYGSMNHLKSQEASLPLSGDAGALPMIFQTLEVEYLNYVNH